MVEQILPLFENIFSKCAEWTSSLLDAVGGKGVVLASFIIVLAIGLLFIPMRGIGLNIDSGGMTDFIQQATYSGKFSKPRKTDDSKYKGKYEKRKQGGHRATPVSKH